jgi:hypothetical protein
MYTQTDYFASPPSYIWNADYEPNRKERESNLEFPLPEILTTTEKPTKSENKK